MAERKVICDTDVMIDYWNIANDRHSATKSTIDNQIKISNVILSVISQMELTVGAINKNDLAIINRQLNSIIIASINDDITRTALTLLQKYALSHRLGLADAMIAATAVVTNLELFTYNTKDYKFISEISLYKL